MKHNNSISGARKTIILVAAAMIGLCLSEAARCQDDPMLLLQLSPVQGGTITPGPGIHQFGLNAIVTLTAVPKPGYQFVYWLGDVIDPISNRTTVYLDLPKIVMAVFERAEYQFLAEEEGAASAPVPDSRMSASAGDYARQGYTGGGSKGYKTRHLSQPEQKDDFPVPTGDDFPVPVPEPVTGILLALGGLLAARRVANRRAL